MKDFDAYIGRDADPFGGVVRLYIVDRLERRTLLADGTWTTYPEGMKFADGAGLLLPAGAIEAIVVAIAEFQGHTSHADTEARVLREVLDVERRRVDLVLGSVVLGKVTP